MLPRVLVVSLALTVLTTPLLAQRFEPMSPSAVRSMTREAASEARGDSELLVLGLDRRVRARWGSFESFPLRIVARDDLTLTLSTPFMNYRKALIEHLLMRQPLDRLPWIDSAIVSVAPERLDAPDVTEVVVTRDGSAIAPLSDTKNPLRPMTFQNGQGQTSMLHAGDVHFPMKAFEPGAVVTISAVPRSTPSGSTPSGPGSGSSSCSTPLPWC